MLWLSLWLSLWLAPALATFVLSTDETSYSASDTMKLSWSDDGNTPSIDDYATANVLLCTYTSTNTLSCPITLAKGTTITDVTDLSFDLSAVSSEGGSGQYVVQFTGISSSSSSTYVGVYSTSWITLTSFTGSTSANSGTIPSGYSSGSTTDSSDELPGANDTIPASYSNLESSWETPYIYQHGLTRYAPFQPTPNSSVTASMTVTRRYSTSSVSLFTTVIKTPLPITTATPSPSVTPTRYQNHASTQSRGGTGRTATRVTPTAVVRAKRWVD